MNVISVIFDDGGKMLATPTRDNALAQMTQIFICVHLCSFNDPNVTLKITA